MEALVLVGSILLVAIVVIIVDQVRRRRARYELEHRQERQLEAARVAYARGDYSDEAYEAQVERILRGDG